MEQVFVSVPGPWWTRLLYSNETPLKPGLRVRVPLGRSARVGLTVFEKGNSDCSNSVKIKPLSEIIDSTPPIPLELMETMKWFASTWFSGFGIAMKIMLPGKFFEGEELSPLEVENIADSKFTVKYNYEENDSTRYEKYIEMTESSLRGTLFLFSETNAATEFWKKLSPGLKASGVLWPSNTKKQWELWKEAREGKIDFVVGSQSASFVPLKGLSRIVVEDEISGGWRSQKAPVFHYRSVLAARANFAKAELILGGRMPSSKVFLQLPKEEINKKNIDNRLIFVNLHDSSSFPVDAVKDSLPISKPLIRETLTCRENGRWAFWILDRKGYAGELYCSDCGKSLRCANCGGVMRWEERRKRLSCLSCKNRTPIPENCPSCGGPFLEGIRPGLEALSERALLIFKYKYKEVVTLQNDGGKLPSLKNLMKEYPRGALVIGTRRILSLADELPTGMIGWIDSDAEARVAEYDAKARAFTLIYESFWRGLNPEQRKVVVQSRRPGKGWQTGLSRGWSYFWETELKERKEWHLPPYTPMLKIILPKERGKTFIEKLEKENIEYWNSEESVDEMWVRTKKFKVIENLLFPYFEIKNSRVGYPDIALYLD
ncbi:MAG: hypothetical protein ACOXZX_04700 [Synergistaceae bacterium]